MSLLDLSVDIFIKIIEYVYFNDTVSLCSINKKFYNYGTNNKYTNNWKILIDNTFSSIENYTDKLNQIRTYYNKDRYDYLVYAKFVTCFDSITQAIVINLMIVIVF